MKKQIYVFIVSILFLVTIVFPVMGYGGFLFSEEFFEQEKLVASDGAANNHFGYSVAVDDIYAIVGARDADYNGVDSGAAYIFKYVGMNWVEQQKLLPSDGQAGDRFAQSVSIDGDYAVVGTYSSGTVGSAYVFKRVGDIWTQQQKLLAADGASGDRFGGPVCIQGDYIVVGAHTHDDSGRSDVGAVYVFLRVGDTWAQEQKLLAADGETEDEFGSSACIDDEYIVVGAAMDEKSSPNHGAAYVFKHVGPSWVQEQKLIAFDGESNDQFGSSASIDSDKIIIGAFMDDKSSPNHGAAYIFTRSGSTWTHEQKLIAADGADDDEFGVRVAINGDIVLVTAGKDDDKGSNSGSLYVFKFAEASWAEEQKITASDGASGDWFGYGLDFDGYTAIIGALQDDDTGFDSGSAYIFKRNVSVICGDLNFDGSINIADLTYIVAYLFSGGPEPIPDICVADVNNDGGINIADLTYLVAYLFGGGPAPLEDCCIVEVGEIDFDIIDYGMAVENVRKWVLGDLDMGTSFWPTIRNSGSSPIEVHIWQDDMGFGMTGGQWNVDFSARLGAVGTIVIYDPFEEIILPDLIMSGEIEKLDIGILIFKGVPGFTYFGEMTLRLVQTQPPYEEVSFDISNTVSILPI